DLGSRPTLRVLVELELDIVEANGAQLRAAEIEQLVALGRSVAQQQIRLVVAVEVVLVGPVAELHPLEELAGDVGVTRRSGQGGEPIQTGEDAILDRARLDLARPTGDAGHPETAFTYRAHGGLEGRHAAVRP